ncbi:hypothetical protein K461DRAFT_181192 [Myriangium duriaei CBS 260.36]|uniref:Uncharacterized protein n=1 Tax=Myriangium duriaei CBS 260.36 TaxID=1168546 RepID=A0A9P4MF58_9PEZI|nr:hypothetical protein K461DRAFT_181192 [Myriangium duriaei CBS 260.36]
MQQSAGVDIHTFGTIFDSDIFTMSQHLPGPVCRNQKNPRYVRHSDTTLLTLMLTSGAKVGDVLFGRLDDYSPQRQERHRVQAADRHAHAYQQPGCVNFDDTGTAHKSSIGGWRRGCFCTLLIVRHCGQASPTTYEVEHVSIARPVVTHR